MKINSDEFKILKFFGDESYVSFRYGMVFNEDRDTTYRASLSEIGYYNERMNHLLEVFNKKRNIIQKAKNNIVFSKIYPQKGSGFHLLYGSNKFNAREILCNIKPFVIVNIADPNKRSFLYSNDGDKYHAFIFLDQNKILYACQLITEGEEYNTYEFLSKTETSDKKNNYSAFILYIMSSMNNFTERAAFWGDQVLPNRKAYLGSTPITNETQFNITIFEN